MARRPFRRGVLAALAVVLLSPASAVASRVLAPPPRIRVYKNPAVIQGLAVRPSTLTMAADGNFTITGLHWAGWGSASARASGTDHVNNCRPNCASGHIKKVAVSVRLFNRGFYRRKYVYRCYSVTPAPVRYLRRFCLPSH